MRLNRAYERLSGGRSSDDDPPPPPRAFHVWEGMCGCASAETIPSCGRSRRAFFGEGYLGHSVVGRWHREISSHSLGSHPLGSHRKEHGQRGLARQRAKRVSMVGRRVGATVGGGVTRAAGRAGARGRCAEPPRRAHRAPPPAAARGGVSQRGLARRRPDADSDPGLGAPEGLFLVPSSPHASNGPAPGLRGPA